MCAQAMANLPRTTGKCAPVAARAYSHQLNEQFLVTKEGLKSKVFDGKKLADTINKEIQTEINAMVADGKR